MYLELIKDGDDQSITVYFPELDFAKSARSDHRNFKAIKRLAFEYDSLQEGDEEGRARDLLPEEKQELIDLFSVEEALQRRFDRLSERYTVRNGIVHRDGDPIPDSNPWVKQVLAFLDQGVEDWRPLIAFQEKLDSNPNKHSREQFFNFLSLYPFTITEDGDVVLYKHVSERYPSDEDYDRYPFMSTRGGPDTILDDEVQPNGRIKQGIGSVVEHPRGLVHMDPDRACSNGLHCGAYDYANHFGYGGKVLRVLVNPRDVVNVPNHDHKVRVCRYVVLDVAEADSSSEALLVQSREDGITTKIQSPGEASYVPPEATYDMDEGEAAETFVFDATEPQSSPYAVSIAPTFSTHPHDLRDDEPSDIEEECCYDCGEYDEDCLCDEEDYPVDEKGQLEEDFMTSLSTPAPLSDLFAPKPARKRYPSPARWEAIQTERKARKKGIGTLAAREGWVLDGDDPQERKSWIIPAKS